MSLKILNFAQGILEEVVKSGGSLVTTAQAEARLEICRGCEFKGKVEPLPFLKMDGCTKCGCPFSTKPHMKTHFSLTKFSIIVTECPLKRWDIVDKNF